MNMKRNSNIELYRIITMLFIIAHHYVVNSGLTVKNGPIFMDPLNVKSVYLLVFGAFGKTGINCFVLITGYFMCKKEFKLSRFFKLLFKVLFYNILFYFVFYATKQYSFTTFFQYVNPFPKITGNFVTCYLLFVLFIPFINMLIQSLNQEKHLYLIFLLISIYTLLGSIPKYQISYNHIMWYTVIYIIGAYLRLYPNKLLDSKSFTLLITLIVFIISIMSVIILNYLSVKNNVANMWSFFLSDSNKILCLALSVTSFTLFKNINIKYNGLINKLGGASFGVLLIHGNSSAMRNFLWRVLFKNVQVYKLGNQIFLHSVFAVLSIFFVCAAFDILIYQNLEKIFSRHVNTIIAKLKE